MVSTYNATPDDSGRVCENFHSAIELIGRRWSGAIIAAMLGGAQRACHIREAIPGLSDRLLTERLRELEDEGIVVRSVTDDRPPAVHYELTERGRALENVFSSLEQWSAEWSAANASA